MVSADRVLQFLRSKKYAPMRKAQLVDGLAKGKKDRLDLEKAIDHLLRQGEIVHIKKDRLVAPDDANLVSGRIIFRQSGSAMLVDDNKEGQESFAPINIAAEDTWVAMHNDRVVARIEAPPKHPRHRFEKRDPTTRYGRVIRILERARTTMTGCLQKTRLFYYVVPDDPRIIQDIYVPPPSKLDIVPRPEVGDKVVVKLFEWKQRHVNPEGEIIEVLGRNQDPRAELRAIFRKYNLEPEFPDAVRQELDRIPEQVGKKHLRGRIDLRDVFTFTIDPDDAKDFDDALSIESLPEGETRIGIHIADVGAYVKAGSILDKEAKRRGNSTYLVGEVIPMLPHKISSGVCSLVEGEDRLTKTVFLTFSRKGQIRETEFVNSVIRSNKRLTYRQAYALLNERNLDKIRKAPAPPPHQTGFAGRPLSELGDDELNSLREKLQRIWSIAAAIRKRRMDSGCLDLDVPEVKIFVDPEGYAERVERVENDETHQLIEEFMLMANEAVASTLTRNGIPSLYRVHEKPVEEKLNEYREYLATFGILTGDLTKRQEIRKALDRIKNHPQSHMLRVQFLRSLQRARYMAKPLGHYGLNKRNYTHFTSPIRRYSDLVVHRLFESHLEKHLGHVSLGQQGRHYTQGQLDSLGDHLTITEQNSTEAERDHVKLKLLEFFDRELTKKERQKFEAVIADIRNHGMFVELTGSQAYGLVHFSTLRDDLYVLTPDGTALKGRRTKKRYEVGQMVEVSVDRVDRFKRQIDFRITES